LIIRDYFAGRRSFVKGFEDACGIAKTSDWRANLTSG